MNYTISKFKFIAAIAVVLIHSSTFIYNDNMATFANYFWIRPFLEFAVPYFFAVSGYLLSKKKLDYFKPYTYKILKMFLIFSLFYFIVELISNVFFELIAGSTLIESITTVLRDLELVSFINGTFGYVHLWYLWAMFLALILFYIFLKLKLSSSLILIVSIGLFIFFNALSPVTLIEGEVAVSNLLYEGSFAKAIAFLAIGYFVGKHNIMFKNTLVYAFLCALPFVVLFNIEGFEFADQLDILLLPSIFFLAVFFDNYIGQKGWLSVLGGYSTQIYLLHMLFINIYRDMISIWPGLDIGNMYVKVLFLVVVSTVLSIYFYEPLHTVFISPLNRGIDKIVYPLKAYFTKKPQMNK